MRQVYRRTQQLIIASAATLVLSGSAYAQSSVEQTNNNNSFQLPGVSLQSGSDEVRAADGTSCRSAVGGSGAYLDIGIIGNPSNISASQSAYGRIVIPLGGPKKRLDCTKLYELEIERLRVELQLMQMGMGRAPESGDAATEAEAKDSAFNDDGWTQDGR